MWQTRRIDTSAIHLHHINPGNEIIRQAIVTRLGQSAYVTAIRNDVAAIEDVPVAMLDGDFRLNDALALDGDAGEDHRAAREVRHRRGVRDRDGSG